MQLLTSKQTDYENEEDAGKGSGNESAASKPI